MKRVWALLWFATGLLGTAYSVGAIAADSFPLVDAQECRPRAGWARFLEKANSKDRAVKIAYFGGSITAQPGWRVKSLQYFQENYPAKFDEINAAIGGTGSDLGAFRLKQDVLDHQPDLLFVEFAVNDGGTDPMQIQRSIEGIVRQTRRQCPDCDICFVYTITEALVAPLLEGKFPRAASAMEHVADHYGIPSIHMSLEVARLSKEEKLLWKSPLPKTDEETASLKDKFVFAPDGVHPYVTTGHELYLQAIVRSVPKIKSASAVKADHSPGKALIEGNFENARMIPIQQAKLSTGFHGLDSKTDDFGKRWANRMTSLHKCDKAGETITFKFKGTRAAIYDIIGPDCGQVIVTIDDQKPRVVPRFDSYCAYHRLATLFLAADLPDEVHTVKIEIHPDQPDKEKILATRNQKMDAPERFNGINFYPGAILLLGELLPD